MNKHLWTCFLLCGLAGSIGSHATLAEDTPLRIVTWNTEILKAPGFRRGQLDKYRFDHAREKHLERTAAVIETLNPDIINVVEITSVEAVDALIKILHEKGLTDYKGYHVDSNDSFTEMDVALITKIPPDEVDGKTIRTIFSAPDDPTWRQSFSFKGWNGETRNDTTSLSRNSLYYITVGPYKLGFLGLHLKSNPEDSYSNARRMAEKEVGVRIINSQIVGKGYLPVVLGDLNDYDPDVPDPDESRNTQTTVLKDFKDYDKSQPGDELVNALSKIPRQADRYTELWDWNENGAPDGEDVTTTLDHVLLPKELMPYIKRVFIAHVVGLDTSDHYPIVVDLMLPAVQ